MTDVVFPYQHRPRPCFGLTMRRSYASRGEDESRGSHPLFHRQHCRRNILPLVRDELHTCQVNAPAAEKGSGGMPMDRYCGLYLRPSETICMWHYCTAEIRPGPSAPVEQSGEPRSVDVSDRPREDLVPYHHQCSPRGHGAGGLGTGRRHGRGAPARNS